MNLERYFWARQPVIDAALLRRFADFIGPGKLVVDVGAGYDPWPFATEFIDRQDWQQLQGKPVHVLDVELERLPYADQSVDFIYCRHTIEDLHNPTLLLREINRVAKAGYIETPSPLAEVCRGIDALRPPYRGYAHHHWLACVEESKLILLAKFPPIELTIPEADELAIAQALAAGPHLWNTYVAFVGGFEFTVLEQKRDFDLRAEYCGLVARLMNAGRASASKFIREYDINPALFWSTDAQGKLQ